MAIVNGTPNDPENDFNGDGLSDVLWRRNDGAFTEWLGQPDGGFVSNDTNAWELVPTCKATQSSWRASVSHPTHAVLPKSPASIAV